MVWREWPLVVRLALVFIGGVSVAAGAAEEKGEAAHPKSAATAESPGPDSTEAAEQGHAAAPAEPQDQSTPEQLWADLIEGNKRFVEGKPQPRELINTRQELVKGQHPKVMVLGCADSRVSPELVFDKNLGELFVVRTAGNVADRIALGSLEYAVEHLHARVLVVLGHEKCGAVAAAASGEKMPTPNLEAIVQQISPALDRLRPHVSGDQLTRLGEEANVYQSTQNLINNSPIIRQELGAGELTIIKAMYRLGTGEVVRLR